MPVHVRTIRHVRTEGAGGAGSKIHPARTLPSFFPTFTDGHSAIKWTNAIRTCHVSAELDVALLQVESSHNTGIIKESFNRLVLPDGHKNMVKALVAQHFRNKNAPHEQNMNLDLIRGKGECDCLTKD